MVRYKVLECIYIVAFLIFFFSNKIARTKTLLDHFEGDIGSVLLVKKNIELAKVVPLVKCKKACDEYIEMNMVGNENYLVRKH